MKSILYLVMGISTTVLAAGGENSGAGAVMMMSAESSLLIPETDYLRVHHRLSISDKVTVPKLGVMAVRNQNGEITTTDNVLLLPSTTLQDYFAE